MDLAPHGLDLVHFLLGEPIVELKALLQRRVQEYAVDDGGLLIGRTASGVLVSLHVSYNCPEALGRRRLEVLGTSGQLTATDTMGQTAGGTLTFTDGATGRVMPILFESDRSPFTAQIAAFTAALRAGEAGDATLDADLVTMRLLEQAYRDGDRARSHSGVSRSEEPGTHPGPPERDREVRIRPAGLLRNEAVEARS